MSEARVRGSAQLRALLAVTFAIANLVAVPSIARGADIQLASASTPLPQQVAADGIATFSSTLTGYGQPVDPRWLSSTDGSDWLPYVAGTTTIVGSGPKVATLVTTAPRGLDGRQFKVIFYDGVEFGSDVVIAASGSALLRVFSVSGVSPAEGTAGTAIVTISGSGFSDGTTVEYPRSGGGRTRAESTTNSYGVLTARVPADASVGTVAIRVTSFGFSDGTTLTFVVRPVPSIPPSGAILPGGQDVSAGSTLTLSASISGTAPMAYAWQSSVDGASWLAIPDATSTTLAMPATSGLDGSRFRLMATNAAGSFSTGEVVVTVVSLHSFTPTTGFATSGSVAGSSVTLVGSGFTEGTMVSFGGGDWTSSTVTSRTSASAVVPATASSGTIRVRTRSTIAWSDGTFSVNGYTAPTVQLVDPVTETTTGSIRFVASATGTPLPTIRWQSRTDGADWAAISDASSATYTRNVTERDDLRQFRAVATNGIASEATSATVTLTVLWVRGHDASGGIGSLISVHGTGFTDGTGVRFAGSTRVTLATVVDRNHLVVMVPADAISGSLEVVRGTLHAAGGTFTILPPAITTQPLPRDVSAGSNAVFSAAATGWTAVRWERSSSPTSGFTTIPDATSVTFSPVVDGTWDGAYLRAVFSSPGGPTPTESAPLRVVSVASFQPASARTGGIITIAGTGFSDGMSVRFAGSQAWTTAAFSDLTLQVVVPADATSGTVLVRTPQSVGSPLGTVAASQTPFEVLGPRSPTVGGLVVAPVAAGEQLRLAISATDWTSATWELSSGSGWIWLADATTHSLTAQPGLDGRHVRVTVRNADGVVQREALLTVISIGGVTPGEATAGTLVTISGTGFLAGSGLAITIGGVPVSVTIVDRTTATFIVGDAGGQIVATLGSSTALGPILTVNPTSTDPGGGGGGGGGGGTPPSAGVSGARSQTIALSLPATGQAGKTIPLPVTSSAGLKIAYRVDSNRVCIVMGTTLWLLGVGTCTVFATQAGDGSTGATSVTATLAVRAATPVLTHRLVSGRSQASTGVLSVRSGAVVVSWVKTPLTLVGATVELWFSARGSSWKKLASRRVGGSGAVSYRIVATAARAGSYQWRSRGSIASLASASTAIVLRRR